MRHAYLQDEELPFECNRIHETLEHLLLVPDFHPAYHGLIGDEFGSTSLYKVPIPRIKTVNPADNDFK